MLWISDVTQDVEIASYDAPNREFRGVYTYRAIEGCGLPPMTCFDIPDVRVGYAAVRNVDDTGWLYVEDHRGVTVYDTVTREESKVAQLGGYAQNVTLLKPSTRYDEWDGSKWVTNETARKVDDVLQAESQKARLMLAAEQSIRILERAKQLGIATDGELAALTEWERYSVLLMRVDTGEAPDIDLPAVPTV